MALGFADPSFADMMQDAAADHPAADPANRRASAAPATIRSRL